MNIMVFGGITSNCNVITPFIFPCDLRFSTETYIKFLEEEEVLAWVKTGLLEDPVSVITFLNHAL